ncbi:MAG: hypothetical protein HQL96_05435 [Magnetococcales bacterium]|nr:hypothetical protein [Magnetococcales bacterium]
MKSMHGIRRAWGPIGLCLTWILAGCAGRATPFSDYRDPEWQPQREMRVAVLPLENLTTAPNAGVVVAQLLGTELYARGLFRQSGEEDARVLLSGNPVEKDRRTKGAESTRELAEKLGVEALLSGSVSEFAYQHGLREEPVVGMRLTLTRAKDGRVLWQAGHALRGGGVLQRSTLISTAQQAIRDLVGSLDAATRPAP